MKIVLYQSNRLRFINIFINTFNRFCSRSGIRPRSLLLYNITYLKFVCLSANDGFYFMRCLDNNRLSLICSGCQKNGVDIEQFLLVLSERLANSTCYSATSRFLCSTRHALMLFHSKDCLCFFDPKNDGKSPAIAESLTLLNAFEIVRQLDYSGLLCLQSEVPQNSDVERIPGSHVFDITCQVCFTNRAALAIPCGHIFQCTSCWYSLIYTQQHDQNQSERVMDNIDMHSLSLSTKTPTEMTHIRFLRQRHCPVCRGRVISVQHIFV